VTSMAEHDFEKLSGVLDFADAKLGSNSKTRLELAKIQNENIINKLDLLEESHHHLYFKYTSSNSTYKIFLELQRHGGLTTHVVVTCTCPAAKKSQPHLCKHGLAALLWRLPPSEQLLIPAAVTATPTTATAPSTATAAAALAALEGDQGQGSAPSVVDTSARPSVAKKKRFLPPSITNPPSAA
jgi:hypothetical protein